MALDLGFPLSEPAGIRRGAPLALQTAGAFSTQEHLPVRVVPASSTGGGEGRAAGPAPERASLSSRAQAASPSAGTVPMPLGQGCALGRRFSLVSEHHRRVLANGATGSARGATGSARGRTRAPCTRLG